MLTFLMDFLNLTDLSYVLLSILSNVVIWLVGYVFMAIGIRYMAKKLNIKKGLWMAWVPFVNWYLLGKIIGNAVIWGVKVKNPGFWVMILSIAQVTINFLLTIGDYLYITSVLFKVDFIFSSQFLIDWVSGAGIFYSIVSVISLVVDIAFIFFEVSVIFMVFRLYAPESALLFSILSLFLDPPLFGILLFVVRKRERRSFKQYYNVYNPYANYNNGNNFNGGNQAPNQPKQNQSEVDPFPEFSNGNDNQSKSDDSDDFFN